jgi:hypothetical protein
MKSTVGKCGVMECLEAALASIGSFAVSFDVASEVLNQLRSFACSWGIEPSP